jgi:hypothetical protein
VVADSEGGSKRPTEISPGTIDLKAVERLGGLLGALHDFGVVDGSSRLRESLFEPAACMETAENRLRFCGLGGNKWKDEPWFHLGISRLREHAGKVQFLLPRSNVDNEALDVYRALVAQYAPTFQCRLFDDDPIFRLVIVDDRISLLSHYRYRREMDRKKESESGWEKPQLLIRHDAPWSIGHAFLVYFKQMWATASEIGEREIRMVERLDEFRTATP